MEWTDGTDEAVQMLVVDFLTITYDDGRVRDDGKKL
jgi:hypothetical protein